MHKYNFPPGPTDLPLNWINWKALATLITILSIFLIILILTKMEVIQLPEYLLIGLLIISIMIIVSLMLLIIAIVRFKQGKGIPIIGILIFEISRKIEIEKNNVLYK